MKVERNNYGPQAGAVLTLESTDDYYVASDGKKIYLAPDAARELAAKLAEIVNVPTWEEPEGLNALVEVYRPSFGCYSRYVEHDGGWINVATPGNLSWEEVIEDAYSVDVLFPGTES